MDTTLVSINLDPDLAREIDKLASGLDRKRLWVVRALLRTAIRDMKPDALMSGRPTLRAEGE